MDKLTIETIYGYPVEDLIAFACACREQHITKEELHNFVENALAGYQFGYNDFMTAYTETCNEVFGKHIQQEK